jgi:hypothetical protein
MSDFDRPDWQHEHTLLLDTEHNAALAALESNMSNNTRTTTRTATTVQAPATVEVPDAPLTEAEMDLLFSMEAQDTLATTFRPVR